MGFDGGLYKLLVYTEAPQEHVCVVFQQRLQSEVKFIELGILVHSLFSFQGCERDTALPPLARSRSSVLCFRGGDLGSSLKAVCQCKFLQAHCPVLLRTH